MRKGSAEVLTVFRRRCERRTVYEKLIIRPRNELDGSPLKASGDVARGRGFRSWRRSDAECCVRKFISDCCA